MKFELTSLAFHHNGDIPRRYTCEGEDVSPPLAWTSVPEGAKSLALVVDDPDASKEDISGGKLAAPIFSRLMQRCLQNIAVARVGQPVASSNPKETP